MDCIDNEELRQATDGPPSKIAKAKRTTATADCKLEITLKEYTSTVRGDVYDALGSECESLLVCVDERMRLTLPLGAMVGHAMSQAPNHTSSIADCHVCARVYADNDTQTEDDECLDDEKGCPSR
jgi:hypothetical protein